MHQYKNVAVCRLNTKTGFEILLKVTARFILNAICCATAIGKLISAVAVCRGFVRNALSSTGAETCLHRNKQMCMK